MSVNKVILVGRLGTDPELKTIANNQSVARFNLATNETWMKDGQKQERTEWHRIVVWGKMADICGKYLAKGRQVYVEGRLQTRSWEDTQGQKKYSTEVVAQTVQFLNNQPGQQQEGRNTSSSSHGMSTGSGGHEDMNFQDFGPEPQFNGDENVPF